MINDLKRKIIYVHDKLFIHYDSVKKCDVTKQDALHLLGELMLLEPCSYDNFNDIEEMRVYLQKIAIELNLFTHLYNK